MVSIISFLYAIARCIDAVASYRQAKTEVLYLMQDLWNSSRRVFCAGKVMGVGTRKPPVADIVDKFLELKGFLWKQRVQDFF